MTEDMIKKRVDIFYKMKTPAHIVTNDDMWLNGFIMEIGAEFFIINDRKLKRVPVFFKDVRVFDFFVGDIDSLPKEGNDG